MNDDAARVRADVSPAPSAPAAHVVDPEEARLVRAVGRGDREACEQLVHLHLPRIVGFADRMLGDPHEAEDVAQETFARFWRHAARWTPGRARLTTWLHRVATNLCIDRMRRNHEHVAEEPPVAIDPAPGPADSARRRELEGHVRAALLALPERQRLALTLCHYQGLRQDEAATILGVSVHALESLLARGRRGMRDRLSTIAPQLLEDAR